MKPDQRSSQHTLRKSRTPRRASRLVIDFGNPKHQRNLFIVLVITFLATAAFTFSGYQLITYTESSEFCGTLCHPMISQFTRYNISPHANVECAKCHVGPGATFFLRSKIDGMRQVYALLTQTYHRPITSPVHNLRPARETCEKCHTPSSFQDNVIKTIAHFDNDEANTPIQTTLILKMGGWKENKGAVHGIHWHTTSKLEYIASDPQRQNISWVGVENPDGTLTEYFSSDLLSTSRTAFVEQARREGQVRQLDCIDCHNRTAHLIPSPEQAVDDAMQEGQISREIPYIRLKAIEALSAPYTSQSEALAAIGGLSGFYQENYPQVFATYPAEIQAAVALLQQIYSNTTFPDMNLNWQSNPDNEHHTPFAGCFRCHDDDHINLDAQGTIVKTISSKCNLCHTVPIVGRGDDLQVEAPVIAGPLPESHSDFRWTIEHRNTPPEQLQNCYLCHGQGFCNNGACHNLEHPPDMLFRHAEIFKQLDNKIVCQTCHQEVTCKRCHTNGWKTQP